jgi:cytochrome P450
MTRAPMDTAQFIADPFGTLRQARAAGGVVDLEFGAVGVMRYDQVRSLLTDGRLRADFCSFLRRFGVSSGPFYDWMAISPLNRDGAEHQRFRTLMSRTFTPRSVERLRPFLRDAAHALIDGFAGAGTCEFMDAFADPYPSLGLCELIGVPTEDRARFRGWANTIGLGFSPLVAMHVAAVDEALTQLLAYTGALVEARREDPRDDVVSRIAAAAREDGWSDVEAQSFLAGLVFAGHETTKNQLGWMVQVLSEHPPVWGDVAAERVSAADVVEEVLRYRSAVTGVGRTPAEPLEVAGTEVAAGRDVFLSVWSANHDEKVFANPERVDAAHGAAAPHVAFGHGAHHCLGAALARAELQEGLTALVARLDCPTIAEGSVWRPPLGINGPERLPIRFRARS